VLGIRLYKCYHDYLIGTVIKHLKKIRAGIYTRQKRCRRTIIVIFYSRLQWYITTKEPTNIPYPLHAHTRIITALILLWYPIKFIFNLEAEVERHFVSVILGSIINIVNAFVNIILIWTLMWVNRKSVHERERGPASK